MEKRKGSIHYNYLDMVSGYHQETQQNQKKNTMSDNKEVTQTESHSPSSPVRESDRVFIDGAFNLSYAEKLYGHSPEAIAWRKNSKEKRRKDKKSRSQSEKITDDEKSDCIVVSMDRKTHKDWTKWILENTKSF